MWSARASLSESLWASAALGVIEWVMGCWRSFQIDLEHYHWASFDDSPFRCCVILGEQRAGFTAASPPGCGQYGRQLGRRGRNEERRGCVAHLNRWFSAAVTPLNTSAGRHKMTDLAQHLNWLQVSEEINTDLPVCRACMLTIVFHSFHSLWRRLSAAPATRVGAVLKLKLKKFSQCGAANLRTPRASMISRDIISSPFSPHDCCI